LQDEGVAAGAADDVQAGAHTVHSKSGAGSV
jgi:hypothetical protein